MFCSAIVVLCGCSATHSEVPLIISIEPVASRGVAIEAIPPESEAVNRDQLRINPFWEPDEAKYKVLKPGEYIIVSSGAIFGPHVKIEYLSSFNGLHSFRFIKNVPKLGSDTQAKSLDLGIYRVHAYP